MEDNLVGFILAGGVSKRLKTLTSNKPKFFLEINGKKIINYHLDKLSELGINETYIVTGFQKNLVKQTFGYNYKGMDIKYIDNDEFENTGHSFALFLGRSIFKNKNILLIHADVFCDTSLYNILLNSNKPNIMLTDEDFKGENGDEYIIHGYNGVIEGIGRYKSDKIQGEYVGLSRFNIEFLTKLCNHMEEFFIKENKKLNYEVLMDNFLKETKFTINYEKINKKKWVNINYLEDFEKAKKMAINL